MLKCLRRILEMRGSAGLYVTTNGTTSLEALGLVCNALVREILAARRNLDCKTVSIFAYSSTREQSNKKSGTKLKTESETGDRRLTGRVRLARFTRVRLLRHALPISLLILRKNRLFCSLVGTVFLGNFYYNHEQGDTF